MGLFGKKKDKGNKPPNPAAPEPPPNWAAYFNSSDRYERFESAVRNFFKSQGVKVLITDGVILIPPEVSKNHPWGKEMGLTNLGQICAQADESKWPQLISDHFARLGRGHEEIKELEALDSDFDQIAPHLSVRLYEPGDVKKVLDAAVWREDIPGLATMLCLDMPDSIHTVTLERAKKWGPSGADLFDIAIANLERLIDAEPQKTEIDENISIWMMGGDSLYNASLLLLPERLEGVTGKHGGFISAPTRHLTLAIPFDDASALNAVAALIHFTVNFERDGPGSLSRRVWWHRGTERIELPYEITDKGIEVHPTPDFVKIMEELA